MTKSSFSTITLTAIHSGLPVGCSVGAEKPGNITPSHDFHDPSYEDMLRSAIAVGPELAPAGERA